MENIVENSMAIVGISARVEDPKEAANKLTNLWNKFWQSELSNKIPNKLSDTIYAIYHSYTGNYTQAYTCTIGFRIDNTEELPTDFDTINIPEQSYQVFTSSGKQPEALVGTWQQIWKLEQSLNRAYTYDFEIYDERAQDPADAIIDIYIAVK